MWLAVTDGLGIGFLPKTVGDTDPRLVEVIAPRDAWNEQTWTVTRRDLHRSAKVQAFLDVVRQKK